MKRIKKFALNKIAVSSLCLVLLILFSIFPGKTNYENNITEHKRKSDLSYVYLLDNDNYIAKVNMYFDKKSIEENIKERLDIIKNGNSNLKEFHPLIPSNIKINDVKVTKDSVYIDFNKEILNMNKDSFEKMIESIIYSLTEINGINDIYLSVEKKSLKKIPNTNIDLNYPLNRHYGINKEYDLNNLNHISKTIIFFLKGENNNLYYVPVTKINNDEDEKIKIIIKELKSIVNSQNNLNSFINDNLELISYETKDNIMNLTFNDYIYDNNTISNEVGLSISQSVFANYDVNKVIFNTEKKDSISVFNR